MHAFDEANVDRSKRIQSIVTLIESQGRRCALVGGVAVSLWTRERFTKDIDFAVAVSSDSEAESLALVFQQAGYPLAQVFEHKTKGLLSTLRFLVPGGRSEPELDLLFATSGIEREVVDAAEKLELLPRVRVPVARIHHLIAMKLVAESDVRAQDRVDLQALIAVSTKRELELAKTACQLIQERGFAREKDLQAVLAEFVNRWKGDT